VNPRARRKLRQGLQWAVLAAALLILGANRWVINASNAYLFTEESLLPENEVGLVLGTSNFTADGDANPSFRGRIEAAAELYQAHKVMRLIVSGTNPDSHYNEPKRMREALVAAGVPDDAITMDFAGDHTLDSIERAQSVFGLTQFTIITQRYHAYRAVFIARKLGLRAVAFTAPLNGKDLGPRNPVREIFARVSAILELYVLHPGLLR